MPDELVTEMTPCEGSPATFVQPDTLTALAVKLNLADWAIRLFTAARRKSTSNQNDLFLLIMARRLGVLFANRHNNTCRQVAGILEGTKNIRMMLKASSQSDK